MRVIVVGAGIVGLATAWALRREGHEPLVVDRGPIPNPTASSHDRHRLIRLAHAPEDGRNRIIGEAYAAWDRLWAELGRSHYVETGMLLTAREPGDWAYACRTALERAGHEHAIWPRALLAERCPFLRLGPDDWGLFMPRGGALLAERIITDLATGLRRAGVALHENRPVLAVGDGEVTTEEGPLSGDAVVLATGAWTGRLVPTLADELEPRRSVVVYLEPPEEMRAAWEAAPCLLDVGGPWDIYGVPPLEGWGVKFGVGSTSGPEDPDGSRRPRPDEPRRQLDVLRPFLHDLDRYEPTESRVCWTCYTPDEVFRLGALAGGRVVYATGCSGQMFKFGAAVGERLAAAATGRLDGRSLAVWARGGLTGLENAA